MHNQLQQQQASQPTHRSGALTLLSREAQGSWSFIICPSAIDWTHGSCTNMAVIYLVNSKQLLEYQKAMVKTLVYATLWRRSWFIQPPCSSYGSLHIKHSPSQERRLQRLLSCAPWAVRVVKPEVRASTLLQLVVDEECGSSWDITIIRDPIIIKYQRDWAINNEWQWLTMITQHRNHSGERQRHCLVAIPILHCMGEVQRQPGIFTTTRESI